MYNHVVFVPYDIPTVQYWSSLLTPGGPHTAQAKELELKIF